MKMLIFEKIFFTYPVAIAVGALQMTNLLLVVKLKFEKMKKTKFAINKL